MKLTIRALATILLAMMAAQLFAAPDASNAALSNDALWKLAEERAWRSRDLVAEVITTRTEVADGDGETLEIIDETERLTGWNDGKPVRTTDTKKTVVKKSGVSVKFNLTSGGNIFIASREGRLKHAFLRDEMLNGRRSAVYRIDERAANGGDEKALAGEVWIDRETAVPMRGVYQPVKMPANVKSYKMTILYALDGERWAATHATIEAAGGMMFVKRRLKVEKQFTGWVAPVTK